MTCTIVGKKHQILSKSIVVAGLGLSLSLGALAVSAQQNQAGDNQTTVEQQQAPQSQPPQYQQDPQSQAPQNQVAPPASLTLPAGTVIRVRTDEWLSTDRNIIGDAFSATLDQPIVVDGWVIARRGQSETGRVSLVKKAGHGNDASQLGLQLSNLTLVDGQQLALQTQLSQTSAGSSSSPGRDVAVVGTTTGVGAVIGAAADGGAGAAIGAGIGAIGGMIGLATTKGRPTVIPPETVLSFRIEAPVTVSTDRSQFAFQPVTQEDYDSRPGSGRPQHMVAPGGPGYPMYYGYPYAYGYPYGYGYGYYPAPFAFGFYGGYGFGPRFGGFRGGFRR